ncbi:PLP-dependent aminotransferase family protein [Flagellimonas sp. S174]|uniref:aminotransferase-like domain-containing protein n=1 Tax=Flagellimonas sp. S174 TaxID=3410790 RepID=UPI003BF602F2
MTKYTEFANVLESQIKEKILNTGEKLPSLRELHKSSGLSISTILKSMDYLIAKGLIKSKEKSGYYVTYDHTLFDQTPIITKPVGKIDLEEVENLIDQVYLTPTLSPNEIDFSIGVPAKELLPINKIKKAVIEVMHQSADAETKYEPIYGNPDLRRLIAQRSLLAGSNFNLDEIITTSGCMNALTFSLMAISKPGDTVIVESPMFFGVLQLLSSLGLNVIEANTHSSHGLILSDLENILHDQNVTAIITVSNFGAPLGFCMPDQNKKKLVKLANEYDIILVEQDLYGDVFFEKNRPKTCKSYDTENRVILCSSFSKTLAPGYRVGYVVGARYTKEIARLKAYHNITSNSLTHKIVARILETGRYDRYLNYLRKSLEKNLLGYLEYIKKHFPRDIKVSAPKGGFVLWIELKEGIDTNVLFQKCLGHGIRIAPGRLFSLRNQYRNCFRISYGLNWTPEVQKSLITIGKIVTKMYKEKLTPLAPS